MPSLPGPPNHSSPSGALTSVSRETPVLAGSPYSWVQVPAPGSGPRRDSSVRPAACRTSAPANSPAATRLASDSRAPAGMPRHSVPPYGRRTPNSLSTGISAAASDGPSETIRLTR
jgi:hypothetical protein